METLQITQKLREKYRAITYNRSDSQYLNEEHLKEAPDVIKVVLNNLNKEINFEYNNLKKSKCFDDSKVTAHHGIIPTNEKVDVSKMTDKELNVYTEICNFYLMQFLPPIEKEITSLVIDIDENYKLKSNSTLILDNGYKSYFNIEKDDETEEDKESNLSNITKGNYNAITKDYLIKEIETKSLPRYTKSSLTEDMTKVSKYVTNKEIKEILKRKDANKEGENGSIGTSSTRDFIVDTLIERGYLKEEKQKLISTEFGREYYNMLPFNIKTADMTARWWLIQEDIKNGNANEEKLIDSVLDTIKDIINSNQNYTINNINKKNSIGICPCCKKNEIAEFEKSYSCLGYKDKSCNFTIWKVISGKKITLKNVQELLKDGKTSKIENFVSKSGKKFSSKLVIKDSKVIFDFQN